MINYSIHFVLKYLHINFHSKYKKNCYRDLFDKSLQKDYSIKIIAKGNIRIEFSQRNKLIL